MDYGHLYKVIESIENSKELDLRIIATCMHLSPEFGNTYKTITNDGFIIDRKVECLLSSDTSSGIAKSVGLATISFADAYTDLQPQIILVLGDRFELLAAVQAALFMKIPVAHIAGGDTTEGAFDESIRHAITKMSHIHFVTNKTSFARVHQLGEDPKMIFNVGSPTIDYILDNNYIDKTELEKILNFKFLDNNFLFTYHPVTLGYSSDEDDIKEILLALEEFVVNSAIIITKSNADNGGHLINSYLDQFSSKHKNVICVDSLGQHLYYNVMKNVDCMIGNSSSGLYEMPSFNKPTVNIGDRQKGRERADSVLDTPVDQESIVNTIKRALQLDLVNTRNPYGDGESSKKIVEILSSITLNDEILQKKFYQI